MSPIIGGCRPSPREKLGPSFSSCRIGAVNASSGTEYVIPTIDSTPISNQGPLSSCVGNAFSDAIEILRGDGQQVSRLYVYYNARKAHGEEDQDSGTYGYTAAASLISLGVCAEALWPYDPARVNDQPDPNCYVEANSRRAAESYNVDSADGIERAIRANHPVVWCGPVGNAFASYRGGSVLDVERSVIGGHATILCGVRFVGGERQFLLRNSWGEDWGDAGYALVTEAFAGNCYEAWVLTTPA